MLKGKTRDGKEIRSGARSEGHSRLVLLFPWVSRKKRSQVEEITKIEERERSERELTDGGTKKKSKERSKLPRVACL